MSGPAPAELDVDGAGAPPRRNGELAFDAPWQSRMFGLTMSLCEAGRIDWSTFRERLIARIAQWEADHAGGADDIVYEYWEHWQAAFLDVAATAGLITAEQLAERAAELAVRPAGHDHGDHGHSHDRHP